MKNNRCIDRSFKNSRKQAFDEVRMSRLKSAEEEGEEEEAADAVGAGVQSKLLDQ